MSATLAALISELEPTWRIRVLERLDHPAGESSGPWNNAGTGHSALCELNYSPQDGDGNVEVSKAIEVNEQFQISRQLWSFLVEAGRIPEPSAFIHATPHMSFVWGADNVAYLRERHRLLSQHPLFEGMEFSDDPEQIAKWAPLLVAGRVPTGSTSEPEPIAATYSVLGTDVDFGALTKILLDSVTSRGARIDYGADVKLVHRTMDRVWHVMGKPQRREVPPHRAASSSWAPVARR